MKRTDISELFPDASKEQIDKLMGINGTDINTAKGEADNLRTQLAAVQGELDKLKGNDPAKLEKDLAALQAELDGMKQAETIRTMREKVSKEKNIPADLLTGETEDACAAQADAILAYAKNSGYLSFRDGGEVHGSTAPTARDKFAEWAKENL